MPTLKEWLLQSLQHRYEGEKVAHEKEGGEPFRVTHVELITPDPDRIAVSLHDGSGHSRLVMEQDLMPEVL